MSAAPARRRRALAVETAAALVALALALSLLAHLAWSPRAWLLFYDGDSVLPALMAGSVRVGQAQDWSLSAVAFIPESVVYLALAAPGLPVKATIVLNALVTLLGFYAVLRLAAGAALAGRGTAARAASALAAFAAFVGFGLLESSASRESLELASLLATATYYSATVLATVAAAALLARILPGARAGRAVRRDAAVLAAVAALSVLSNPLFGLWAALPVVLIAAAAAAAGLAPARRAAVAVAAVAAGSAIGLVLRMPLGGLLAESPVDKIDPAGAAASARFTAGLLAQRWESDGGWPVIVVVALLLCAGVAATVVAVRRRSVPAAVLATASWLIPLCAVGGAIALGTQSPRYLQPLLFAPVLALPAIAGLVGAVPVRRARRALAVAAAVLALAALAAGSASALVLARDSRTVDASVRCVVDWVEASGRTGAGAFWTVRAPKAYLSDPRALLQVDYELNGYAWLVNDDDFRTGRVSFLVTSFDGELAAPTGLPHPERIDCGAYTILDFGEPVVGIGPAHH